MHRALIFRLYIKRLTVLLVFISVCNIAVSNILEPLLCGVTPNDIDRNLVYYTGDSVAKYKGYAEDNGLKYELSPSVLGGKDFSISLPEGSIEQVYLYDLDYLKQSTKDLTVNNMNILNKDNKKFISLDDVYVSLFPSEINNYQAFNERLQVKGVLAGGYPLNEDEIMIPEVYAVKLANDKGFTKYDQLIGQTVSYEDTAYKIVGVYNGANHIIVSADKEAREIYKKSMDESIFIRFKDRAQKIEFYKQFDKREVVNSSDFYINNIKYYIPSLLKIVIWGIGILFVILEQKKYVEVLNHQSYKVTNYLIPLIIPLSLLSSMFLI